MSTAVMFPLFERFQWDGKSEKTDRSVEEGTENGRWLISNECKHITVK
jgi:hypothetical protein